MIFQNFLIFDQNMSKTTNVENPQKFFRTTNFLKKMQKNLVDPS